MSLHSQAGRRPRSRSLHLHLTAVGSLPALGSGEFCAGPCCLYAFLLELTAHVLRYPFGTGQQPSLRAWPDCDRETDVPEVGHLHRRPLVRLFLTSALLCLAPASVSPSFIMSCTSVRTHHYLPRALALSASHVADSSFCISAGSGARSTAYGQSTWQQVLMQSWMQGAGCAAGLCLCM